jgi:hypothetical protein
MSTAQINAWLEAAHEDVGRLLAPTSDGHEHRPAIVHATHRLYDARPALPGSPDDNGHSAPGSSTPPGFGQIDIAKTDRDEAHRRAKRIRDDADWLTRMAQRWNPRIPTPKDRELSSINGKDDPGCEHCHTVGKWAAVYKPRTTCNGNFDDPKALCSWCWRYCLDTGDMPTRKQLEDHHNGVRVKRPA